jgi:hypothetical protein
MNHLTERQALFLAVALGSFLFCGTRVGAEESATRDYDRFDLRVGGGWVFGADTTVSLIGARGVGTVIDFDKTLDGETSNSLFRVDANWNWAKRHGVSYTWYDVNRTGYRAIGQDLEFGDQTFPVGATLNSQLDIKLNRLMYHYGLARNEEVNLDIGGGFYYANIGMTLTAIGNFGSITDGTSKAVSLKAPLPTAGLKLEYKWTPRLSSTFLADFFYFSYNDWEGALTDIQFGLAYKITSHWTLGAAYDRFVINLEGPSGDESHFQVDNAWNSLYSYLSFHW